MDSGWLNLVDKGQSTNTQPGILGKAGTGAILSLDAIGAQDTFLISNSNLSSNNVTESFFQFKNLQHTQFSKYTASVQVNNPDISNWPFNQVVTVNLRPKEMGDILQNMYLKCTLPPLNNNAQYASNVGWAILNKIQFQVDDVIIEIIQCDWNIINQELFYSRSEKIIVSQLINVDPFNGGNLYIPLEFFFNRKHLSSFTTLESADVNDKIFKPGFLTCAASNHRNIKITLTFNPITFFCSADENGNAPNVSLSSFYIVTEEIILSNEERNYLKNTVQKNMLTIIRNEAVQPVSSTPWLVNLTPSIPIKTMHWFMRKQAYEDQSDPTQYQNRFNYSNFDYDYCNNTYILLTDIFQESRYPIVSQSILYLNGVEVLGISQPITNTEFRDGSYYYKFSQPLSHSLSTPYKNIYTNSFCVKPTSPEPSGSLDFSKMDSNTTFLTGSLYQDTDVNGTPITISNSYNLYVYYTGYNQITYKDGLVSLASAW
jgi:hypothetical protein